LRWVPNDALQNYNNNKKDFSTKVDSQNLFQSQNSQLHSFFTVLKNLDNHSRSSVSYTCALILWKSLKMVICSIKNFWNLCKKCFLITCITVYSLLFEKSCPVNLVYIFFCSAPPMYNWHLTLNDYLNSLKLWKNCEVENFEIEINSVNQP
jgi:ABC-type siderophore export system fused ATPase/permease subunit